MFEVAGGSGSITTLASFDGANGEDPEAGLIEDSSGNLFGTTESGGASGDGTVFEVAAGGASITTLASFLGSNGQSPQAGLVEDSSGNLFGTTAGGGPSFNGTVFEVVAGSGNITTLASFIGVINGATPRAELVEDSSGNLFGTTFSGVGANAQGTLFELVAGSRSITTLASFNGTNGDGPEGGLVEDSSGNLFGTTGSGGASGDGTVFEVTAGSGTVTILTSFDGADGANPVGGVVEDNSGNLFGTTESGGASGAGTVFELAAGSGSITILSSFNGSNGQNPHAGLIENSGGNLFGTTFSGTGTANGVGTVFEVAAGSGSITSLASFNGANGDGPVAGLVEDSSGNLFGTTEVGGVEDGGLGGLRAGTVFELAAGSDSIETLGLFNHTNGQNPTAGLVEDNRGNLFGTTELGGADGIGNVFELTAGTGNITTLASFNGTNGEEPVAGLVKDINGDLFGTTEGGGTSDNGTVSKLWSVVAASPSWPPSTARMGPHPWAAWLRTTTAICSGRPNRDARQATAQCSK